MNLNKEMYIENIYCSIDINNIENYLKRSDKLSNSFKPEIKLIIVPNQYIYGIEQIYWGIFIALNKFEDRINISKKLWTEVLLTLDCTDQINRINKKWYLKEGKSNYFVFILSSNKLKAKDLKLVKKELDINKLENIRCFKTKAKEYYKIKNNKQVLDQIIEQMSTSYLKS